MSSIREMRRTTQTERTKLDTVPSFTGGTASIRKLRDQKLPTRTPVRQAAPITAPQEQAKQQSNPRGREVGLQQATREYAPQHTSQQGLLNVPKEHPSSDAQGEDWTKVGQRFLENSPMKNGATPLKSKNDDLRFHRRLVTFAPQVLRAQDRLLGEEIADYENTARGIRTTARRLDDIRFHYGGERNEDGSLSFPTQKGADAYNQAVEMLLNDETAMQAYAARIQETAASRDHAYAAYTQSRDNAFAAYSELNPQDIKLLAQTGDAVAHLYLQRENEKTLKKAQSYIDGGGTTELAIDDFDAAEKAYVRAATEYQNNGADLKNIVTGFLQMYAADERYASLENAAKLDEKEAEQKDSALTYTRFFTLLEQYGIPKDSMESVSLNWSAVPLSAAQSNANAMFGVMKEKEAALLDSSEIKNAVWTYNVEQVITDKTFDLRSAPNEEIANKMDGDLGGIYRFLVLQAGIKTDIKDYNEVEELWKSYEIRGKTLNCGAIAQMSDSEKRLFFYYCNTGNYAMSELLLADLSNTLTQRAGEAIADTLDIPVVRELVAFGIGLGKGVEAVGYGIGSIFADIEPPELDSSDYMLGSWQEKHQKTLSGFTTAAFQNIGNMMPSVAGYLVHPYIGTAATFLNARGNAYVEAKRNGYTHGQAWVYSTLVGASEAGLERLLGRMGGIAEGFLPKKMATLMSRVKSVAGRLAKDYALNTVSELLEENLQNYLEPAFAMFVGAADHYEAPDLDDFIETSVVTLMTTTVFAAFQTPGKVRQLKFDDQMGKWADAAMKADRNSNVYQEGAKIRELLAKGEHISGAYMQDVFTRLGEDASRQVSAVAMETALTGHAEGRLGDTDMQFFTTETALEDSNEVLQAWGAVNWIVGNENASHTTAALAANAIKLAQAAQTNLDRALALEEIKQEEYESATDNMRYVSESATNALRNFVERGLAPEKTAGQQTKTLNSGTNLQSAETNRQYQNNGSMEESGRAGIQNDSGLIYNALVSLGVQKAAAESLAKSYDPAEGISPEVYARGAAEAFFYGKGSFSEAELRNGKGLSPILTELQRNTAYRLGQIMNDTRRTNPPYGVERNEFTARLDPKLVSAVDALAKLFRTKVRFGDLGGNNGLYHPDTGLIELDIAPQHRGASNAFLFSASHELGHAVKDRIGSKAWNAFAEYAVKAKGGEDAVKAKQESAAEYSEYSVAREEVVCDFIGELLSEQTALDNLCASIKNGAVKLETARGIVAAWRKVLDIFKGKGAQQTDAETAALVKRVQEQFGADIETAENAVRQMQQALAAAMKAEKNTTSNDEAKKSFKGYDPETGRGIYESNFPFGTPKSEKGKVILNYIQNVWSKKPIPLVIRNSDGSTRTIYAQFDPTFIDDPRARTDASKLMVGPKHGSGSDKRVTLDLAKDYYQIASESEYNYSKSEVGKQLDTHNNVKEWHYFINDILFREYGENETKPYRVTINVKERDDGSFVYSFSAEKQEEGTNTRQTLHADVTPTKNRGGNAHSFLDSIREDSSKSQPHTVKKGEKNSQNEAAVGPENKNDIESGTAKASKKDNTKKSATSPLSGSPAMQENTNIEIAAELNQNTPEETATLSDSDMHNAASNESRSDQEQPTVQSLLMDMDVSKVKNATERKYLKEYQETATRQLAEQQKLDKLQAELDALPKDNRQTSRARFLRDELIKTKNRLQICQSIQTRLETDSPLTYLITREVEPRLAERQKTATPQTLIESAILPSGQNGESDFATEQNKHGQERQHKRGQTAVAEPPKFDIIMTRAAAASIYVNSSTDLFRNAKNISPIEGYEDIVIHGSKYGFEIRNADDKPIGIYSVNEFCDILKDDPNYHGGAIRLISCEAGADGSFVAQGLANRLGVVVLAPTDTVWVFPDGSMVIGEDEFTNSGEWREFLPKRKR